MKYNPTAEGERIKKLMERIESGDIKIPKFQRNFVWKQKSIINLLDSLYKGYPIGSVLFWRTKTKIKGERNIGGYVLQDTKESYPTNYVLDGQQRLTIIYSVFTNRKNHPGMNDIFDINYDLNAKEFMPYQQASAESIPLHALFDNKEFLNHIREFTPQMVDEASELQEIFMNYEIPIVTVFDMDIEEVSIIFERINSTAKTLTVFDLMVAATWFEKFDLRDHIDFLKKELQKKHFSNAIIALLSNQKPRNLITGTKIDLTKALSVYNRKEFHHIFPVAFLKSNKIDGITLNNINSVCNIIILSSSENKQIGSKAPSKFFTGSHNTFLN